MKSLILAPTDFDTAAVCDHKFLFKRLQDELDFDILYTNNPDSNILKKYDYPTQP